MYLDGNGFYWCRKCTIRQKPT